MNRLIFIFLLILAGGTMIFDFYDGMSDVKVSIGFLFYAFASGMLFSILLIGIGDG